MRSWVFAAFVIASCATGVDVPDQQGLEGTAAAAGSSAASGGEAGTGASAGTGGEAGTGGTVGTAGTAGTAGTGGTAGSSGAGAGGASAGSSGAGSGGTSGAGGTGGTAGTAGAGGTAGTAGTGGTGGSAGTAGAGGTAGTAGTAGTGGTGGLDAGSDASAGSAGAPSDAGTDASPACLQALTAARHDFESGASGWTHAAMDGVSGSWTFDSWQQGTATSGPGSCHGGAKCWATNLAGNYVQCQRAQLRSPPMSLAACAGQSLKLVFFHWYDFWSGTYGSKLWYDGGLVEISANGTSGWTAIAASPPGTIDINPDMGSFYSCLASSNFYVDGKPGYTQASSGWQRVEADIPPGFVTSSFAVRFAYGSGVSYKTTSESVSMQHTRPGWYVDDVSVEPK